MKNVLEYLERSAAREPEKTAVTDEGESLSYAALLRESRRVGTALARRCVPGSPVPVLMDKSVNALCAFLGAAWAGCFYVPLNPELPAPRLRQVLEVLEADWVITDEAGKALAGELVQAEHIVSVEPLRQGEEDEPLLSLRRAGQLDTDPLYTNFTSGSTGIPKGVVVGHRSVIDFIDVFTRQFGISEKDIIGNQAPLDFDVSVKDIYSALAVGATLVIIPRRLFSLPAALLDYICDHEVTTLIWAVSALCLVSTFHGLDYRTPERVNKVLFSGEVMPERHLKSWMEHLPEAAFVNLYGPTEVTCNCTFHVVDRGREYPDGLPIGKPFSNEGVFLLDEEGHAVTEPGINGELCVRGSCLALGYYRSPEQTAAHFTPNPLRPAYPERIYRTGDLAHWNEAGELCFAGRRDFQIKHMGHRIELEEVERAMGAVPGVERACCVFDAKRGKLLGFYVGSLDKKELHHAMSESLPRFMVPGVLTRLEALPMTKNGKIDRKALLERRKGGRE
ncbi:MAG: amino acid adenylation domain-containing protein [Clostridiales bacterium]|nr:amino acid adenylation domain-containing protein [Clostridiales bacterium]